jgi:DNA-binding response OmpR family regulator
MHILIVEDEQAIAKSLADSLQLEGYDTSVAPNGEDAFLRLTTESYDLVILDWMLPGRSGIEVLKLIRDRGMKIPVLLLTARDQIDDRVEGLDAGADDYLVKPFALAELLARVRTLLRRADNGEQHRVVIGDMIIDRLQRKVSRSGSHIELTPREFNLLEYFSLHQGKIISREMLAKDVWKEHDRATPIDNVIDVHIGRLRKKIDTNYGQKLLQTIRGVGFMLGGQLR